MKGEPTQNEAWTNTEDVPINHYTTTFLSQVLNDTITTLLRCYITPAQCVISILSQNHNIETQRDTHTYHMHARVHVHV